MPPRIYVPMLGLTFTGIMLGGTFLLVTLVIDIIVIAVVALS